jgi:hypothetical protein
MNREAQKVTPGFSRVGTEMGCEARMRASRCRAIMEDRCASAPNDDPYRRLTVTPPPRLIPFAVSWTSSGTGGGQPWKPIWSGPLGADRLAFSN